MKFDQQQSIYMQVANYMADKIIKKDWDESERIPSVRDVAALLQVNPNTVMRSFALLQDHDIIANRRGVGYFVADQGIKSALKWKRREFTEELLPRFFNQANTLGLTSSELQNLYDKFLDNEKKSK